MAPKAWFWSVKSSPVGYWHQWLNTAAVICESTAAGYPDVCLNSSSDHFFVGCADTVKHLFPHLVHTSPERMPVTLSAAVVIRLPMVMAIVIDQVCHVIVCG
jgi:hypothetical protein